MTDEFINQVETITENLKKDIEHLNSDKLQQEEEFKQFEPAVAKGIILVGLLNEAIYNLSMIKQTVKNQTTYNLKNLDSKEYSSILAEAEFERINNMTGFKSAAEIESILEEFNKYI